MESYGRRTKSVSMLARFALLTILLGTNSMACPRSGQSPAVELTNGWVEMNARRELYIVYDAEPGTLLSAFPGEAAYSGYVELASGIEPGQRKRINTLADTYRTDDDGSYSIFRYLEARGTTPEPGQLVIGLSDPQYRCYGDVLRRAPGQHLMSLAERRRIDACLGARPR